jgi:hypothetical protein
MAQRRPIICPNLNCGYRGQPRRIARSDTLTGCLLLILFFPLGILYFIIRSGYRRVCPNCGIQISSDA